MSPDDKDRQKDKEKEREALEEYHRQADELYYEENVDDSDDSESEM